MLRKALAIAIAVSFLPLLGCRETEHYFREHPTAQGAAIGAGAGAAGGAIIGEASSGEAAKGALIGGALGTAAGAAGGYMVEKNRNDRHHH